MLTIIIMHTHIRHLLYHEYYRCFSPQGMSSPLQDEWRVGLAVARVVNMDGVSTVGSELTQSTLAATHALCQTAAGACCTQCEGAMVSMAHHQWVGAGNVARGGRDVSCWKKNREP